MYHCMIHVLLSVITISSCLFSHLLGFDSTQSASNKWAFTSLLWFISVHIYIYICMYIPSIFVATGFSWKLDQITPNIITMVLLQHLEQGIRPITRYYNPLTYSNTHASLLHGFPSTAATSSSKLFFRNSAMKQKSKAESKEIAAKKHSDAERRRRLRINCQFATLRTILPNLAKQDKASVLRETVRYLNELKKTVKDIEMATPRMEDNLKLSQCNRGLAKVVFNCSDRKGLMSEIAGSLATTKGKAIRAEIVTVGGRTKCALYVQGVNGNEGMVRLKKALKPILNRDLSKNNRITTFHQSS